MSSVNSFYMADVIFDGSDGEMKGINIFGDNFQDLIENIEKKSVNQTEEGWSQMKLEKSKAKE